MSATEAHVELLLGRLVVDPDGQRLGRIEDIRAVAHGGQLYVSQYIIGRQGVAGRLTSVSLIPRVIHSLGVGHKRRGYVVPWTWMDLSDPEHPRTTRRMDELPAIDGQEPPYQPKGD
jgi:sporulation protein YlmC with PRC-barrel domain